MITWKNSSLWERKTFEKRKKDKKNSKNIAKFKELARILVIKRKLGLYKELYKENENKNLKFDRFMIARVLWHDKNHISKGKNWH